MTVVCRIHGARDLRVENALSVELEPHEVEMRLGAGGICGSDLHYFQHARVGAFAMREPLIPGHEVSGVVERIGSAVTRVKPGDKVAVNPSHACGHCDYCRGGRFNLCRHMRFLGSASVYPHVQGMFRERFVMGEAQLTPITEDISLGEIACAEPLSIGLHAVHRAGELLGKTVLVTGGGTIGCMSVLAARMAGAAEVIVCDIADRALAIARQVGADRTSAPTRSRRRNWPTSPTSPSKPPAARPHWPPACRPRAAAGASCRWARCRPKACRSRPTA
jgi:L-idonate 5-dehydrogenase